MPDFKLTDVETMRIDSTVKGIADDVKEMNSILAEIKNNIAPPLDQCWQGHAKQSFDNRLAILLANCLEIANEYSQLNEQLKKAGETYSSANEAAKQLIAKLPK